MSITFWFDPCCPFTWRTSRWLRDVATRRGESVQWRFLSLAMLNVDKPDVPERRRQAWDRALGALRVLAAAEESAGQGGVDRLYTALGQRVHDVDDEFTPEVIAASLADAKLPAELAGAFGDAGYDAKLRESLAASQARVGAESGSPVTALDEGPGFFGPVVVPVPRGEDGDRLFEALRLLSSVPQFSELKRSRNPL